MANLFLVLRATATDVFMSISGAEISGRSYLCREQQKDALTFNLLVQDLT